MEAFKEILGIQSNIEAFYWMIAILSTSLFFVKIILSIFGGEADDIDFDGDVDTEIDSDVDGEEHGGSIISINTVMAFLKGAGWIGVICYRFTKFTSVLVVPITLLSGIITFFFAVFILKKMKSLESSGTLNYKNAIGATGKVYLTIPKAGEGSGQVQVEVQERLMTLNAKSDKDEIKTGEKILVCSIDRKDNIVIVTPFSDIEKY